jgi:hypothetical protein
MNRYITLYADLHGRKEEKKKDLSRPCRFPRLLIHVLLFRSLCLGCSIDPFFLGVQHPLIDKLIPLMTTTTHPPGQHDPQNSIGCTIRGSQRYELKETGGLTLPKSLAVGLWLRTLELGCPRTCAGLWRARLRIR